MTHTWQFWTLDSILAILAWAAGMWLAGKVWYGK